MKNSTVSTAGNTQPAPSTHLQGRRLIIARVTWTILVVLTLAFFIAMLPAYFVQLQTVCSGAACAPGQPTPDMVRVLQTHALTIASYALFTFTFTLIAALACCVVGVMIFWRRSDDWMALLVALTLMMAGSAYVTYSLLQSNSVWQWPALTLNTFTFSVVFLFFSLFPDGRFVPRWTYWLTIGWIGWEIAFIAFLNLSFSRLLNTLLFPRLLNNLVWLCLYGCSVIAQIYRYRRVSDPVQRQQTKWIVFGAVITMMAVMGLKVPTLIFPSLGPGSLYDLASVPGFTLALIPFPLSIGFAVLRYRLWEIDVLINRTLIYGTLATVLGLAALCILLAQQQLVQVLPGPLAELLVIASILALMLSFQNLRHHIQSFVDRRFYPHKYRAEQALEAFTVTLRHEVDVSRLNEELLEVVSETMEPAFVSLWIDTPEPQNEAPRYTGVLRQ